MTPTLPARPSDLHIGPTLAYPPQSRLPADLLRYLFSRHICGTYPDRVIDGVCEEAARRLAADPEREPVSVLEDCLEELRDGRAD